MKWNQLPKVGLKGVGSMVSGKGLESSPKGGRKIEIVVHERYKKRDRALYHFG